MSDHPAANPDIATVRRILASYRRIAVVGLSASWYRPSYFAAKYLIDHGYEVFPVNPGHDEILGRRSHARVAEVPPPVEVVDIFRRAEEVPDLVEEAIAVGARVVWMQLGVIHEPAAERARAAGLEVVMDRCMKIEHARLFGGLHFAGVDTGVISARRPHHVPH